MRVYTTKRTDSGFAKRRIWAFLNPEAAKAITDKYAQSVKNSCRPPPQEEPTQEAQMVLDDDSPSQETSQLTSEQYMELLNSVGLPFTTQMKLMEFRVPEREELLDGAVILLKISKGK